jgi:hypothetical protein
MECMSWLKTYLRKFQKNKEYKIVEQQTWKRTQVSKSGTETSQSHSEIVQKDMLNSLLPP